MTSDQLGILILALVSLVLLTVALMAMLSNNPYRYESFDDWRIRQLLACKNRASHSAHGHCVGVPPVVWYVSKAAGK